MFDKTLATTYRWLDDLGRTLGWQDRERSYRALRAVLSGEDRGAHRDCLMLGASLALEVAGMVSSPREGVERAAQAIDSGASRKLLDSLAAFGATLPPSNVPAGASVSAAPAAAATAATTGKPA